MSSRKNIIIVGGGTAGWMSANILAFSFKHHGIDISVLESPDIKAIGVGEGSTPALKVFFDKLNIQESEWMPACNGTYKVGITFENWSTKPGFSQYFHPFVSQIDQQTITVFTQHAQARLHGLNVEAQPNHFFLGAHLAAKNLAPLAHYNFPFDTYYGYHFDAELLGRFLQRKAMELGVKHYSGTVEHISQLPSGEIDQLTTKDQQVFKADLYLDCSGFRSLLSQTTLATPYLSYANLLANDAAVALPTVLGDTLPSQTLATALKHGWAWRIPLQNRFGNGYVYSSKYCSADQAETELRQRLNLMDSDIEARHLKMRVGRVKKSWNKNVLAVGLAQGFIEPLEATALALIQQTTSLFAHYFLQGNYSNKYETLFNQRINEQFDGTRDYIVAHYQTNSRNDTEYWRDCRANQKDISDSLKRIFECWSTGEDLAEEITHQKIESFYPVSSWYCLLAGMGMFPEIRQRKDMENKAHLFDTGKMADFFQRCTLNFDDHKVTLQNIGQKNMAPFREAIATSQDKKASKANASCSI